MAKEEMRNGFDGSAEPFTFAEPVVVEPQIDTYRGQYTRKEQRVTLDGVEEVEIVVLPPIDAPKITTSIDLVEQDILKHLRGEK